MLPSAISGQLYILCCGFFFTAVTAQVDQASAFFSTSLSTIFNATWDSQVRSLCSAAAMSSCPKSNSVGIIICYNVAAIQPPSGLFAGDLRLYSSGAPSIPSTASIQVTLDFGTAASVQNFTSLQSDNTKRSLREFDSGLTVTGSNIPILHVRQVQASAVAPTNTIRAGSNAGIASTQSGIKPIVASATLGTSTTAPAVLPGETRLKIAKQAAQATTSPLTSATVSGIQTSATALAPGTQIETIQLLGRVNLDVANANPDGSGMLGSLLPRVLLAISNPGAMNVTVDMTAFTRSFLIGIQGRKNVAGAFVFPGRILGGADKSASLVGLYLVYSYTVLFLVTMVTGILTRYNMRKEFRNRARQVGRQFVT